MSESKHSVYVSRRGAGLAASVAVHLILLAVVLSMSTPDVRERPLPAHKIVHLMAPRELAHLARTKPPNITRISGSTPAAGLEAIPSAIPDAPQPTAMIPAAAPNLIIIQPQAPPQLAPVPKPTVWPAPAITFATAVNQPAGVPTRTMASAGFDGVRSESRSNNGLARTELGGFGGPSVEPVKPRIPRQGIAGFQAASFGEVRTTDQKTEPRIAPLPAAAETPVRITSKPKPVYTEEARKLGIRGDVVLEVTFSASGTVQIVRLVRGLGHGLDEAAAEAAKSLVFEPAKRGGQPIDVTTKVRIEFQLIS